MRGFSFQNLRVSVLKYEINVSRFKKNSLINNNSMNRYDDMSSSQNVKVFAETLTVDYLEQEPQFSFLRAYSD